MNDVATPEAKQLADLTMTELEAIVARLFKQHDERRTKSDDARLPLAPTPKLFAALVQAQASVRAVEKGAFNKHHGYAYASQDEIIAEAGRALTGAGLALMPLGFTVRPAQLDADHHQIALARLFSRYRLVHQSGEHYDFDPVSVPVIPDKGRPEDKAEAAARTFALGYFLRDLLLIPRVDEQGVDDRNDTSREPTQPGPAKAAPPSAKPTPAAAPKPAPQQDEGYARASIAIVEKITGELKAAPTDPELVLASKPARKAFNDGAITQAQLDALTKTFTDCRKALAAKPAAPADVPSHASPANAAGAS